MVQRQFSIIIPVLNEAATIQNSLLTLQSLRDRADIIVVDGGSVDDTVARATPYADKILLAKQGRATQMNHGASAATGDILVFLHADTELPEHALALIAQGIHKHQPWGRFNIQLAGKHFMFTVIAVFMNWRSRITGIATGDQVLFVTKTAFNAVGGYPEIALMEDIAVSRALKKISPPVCLTVQVKSSARRWEHYGIYRTILLMWSLRLQYWLGVDPELLAKHYRTGTLWIRSFD